MQQSMSFPLPWRFLLFLLKIQVIYMFTSTTRSFIHQNYHYHQRIASYDTTMMIRSSQDAVVIGGGVGGLVCASLLASSSQPGMYGMNITILEKNTNIGGRMSSEYLMSSSSPSLSYRFDVGPSLLLLRDVYEQTFQSIGCQLHDYVDLLEVKPLYKCYFSDLTCMNIHKNPELMRKELENEEKGAYEAYLRYMYHAGIFLEFG